MMLTPVEDDDTDCWHITLDHLLLTTVQPEHLLWPENAGSQDHAPQSHVAGHIHVINTRSECWYRVTDTNLQLIINTAEEDWRLSSWNRCFRLKELIIYFKSLTLNLFVRTKSFNWRLCLIAPECVLCTGCFIIWMLCRYRVCCEGELLSVSLLQVWERSTSLFQEGVWTSQRVMMIID